MLKPLGVGPIKFGPENRLQGYRRGQFADYLDRYLTPLSSLSNLTATHNLDISNTSDLFATGQAKTAVRFENSSKSSTHNEMTGCPVWKGGSGDNAHMCAQCGKPPDGRRSARSPMRKSGCIPNVSAPTLMEGEAEKAGSRPSPCSVPLQPGNDVHSAAREARARCGSSTATRRTSGIPTARSGISRPPKEKAPMIDDVRGVAKIASRQSL